MIDDPLDTYDEGVPRDGYGRPLIPPAKKDGSPNPNGKGVPYTRASTFAKALDDGAGLTKWKVRHAAVGIASSPDLAAMVAAMGGDLNAYDANDKKALDAIIDRAHDRSGGNMKADYGTAVHSMTEPDRDPLAIDEDMSADVAAYHALLAELGVEVVSTEVLVVVDEVKVAGTFDHVYRLTRDLTFEPVKGKPVTIKADTMLVVDKKTGRLSLLPHAIQLATYAHGVIYNHATGSRAALPVSTAWGLVIHVPRGEGVARAYAVDLTAGWKLAKLAGDVRTARSTERKLGTLVAEGAAPVDDSLDDLPTHMLVDPADDGEPVEGVIERVEPAPSQDPGDPASPADRIVEAEVVGDLVGSEPAPPPPDKVADPGVGHEPAAPPAELTTADAVANIARAGLAPTDALLGLIAEATTPEACRALWSKHRDAWQDSHTAAVKRRLTELDPAS